MSTTVQYTNVSTSASEVALHIKKPQGMALSAWTDINGLNHALLIQQLITQLALYKLEIPGKVEILIVHTNH